MADRHHFALVTRTRGSHPCDPESGWQSARKGSGVNTVHDHRAAGQDRAVSAVFPVWAVPVVGGNRFHTRSPSRRSEWRTS
jgi:hypothetical protein